MQPIRFTAAQVVLSTCLGIAVGHIGGYSMGYNKAESLWKKQVSTMLENRKEERLSQ